MSRGYTTGSTNSVIRTCLVGLYSAWRSQSHQASMGNAFRWDPVYTSLCVLVSHIWKQADHWSDKGRLTSEPHQRGAIGHLRVKQNRIEIKEHNVIFLYITFITSPPPPPSQPPNKTLCTNNTDVHCSFSGTKEKSNLQKKGSDITF